MTTLGMISASASKGTANMSSSAELPFSRRDSTKEVMCRWSYQTIKKRKHRENEKVSENKSLHFFIFVLNTMVDSNTTRFLYHWFKWNELSFGASSNNNNNRIRKVLWYMDNGRSSNYWLFLTGCCNPHGVLHSQGRAGTLHHVSEARWFPLHQRSLKGSTLTKHWF